MARKGRVSNLKKSANYAYTTVARAKGHKKCGRSPRGAKRTVCLATEPVAGMKCGRNPINNLYACVGKGRG